MRAWSIMSRKLGEGLEGESLTVVTDRWRSVLLPERAETSLFPGDDSLCKAKERGPGSKHSRKVSGRGSTCNGEGGHQLCPDSSLGSASPAGSRWEPDCRPG